ncbi:MAG: stage 0 sporulation family protein [Eubacteriales bacterium]
MDKEKVEIVGVRFKSVGKIYYFAPNGLQVKEGDRVIVETVRGQEIGTVIVPNRFVAPNEKFDPLSPVVRAATAEDLENDAKNREKEKKAFAICQEKIKKHDLQMNLVDVEYTFDNSKIIFFFVAEGRIDFRELVKDLAYVFKTRIELRQIGVRDETKTMGGLGVCGRPVCCASFLSEFAPVSVRMAKDQSLSTNPQKISGTCGKLICCLNYEQNAYEDAYKTMPRVGNTVKTADGVGNVTESNILTGIVRVKIVREGEYSFKTYPASEVQIIKKQDKNAPAADRNDEENAEE